MSSPGLIQPVIAPGNTAGIMSDAQQQLAIVHQLLPQILAKAIPPTDQSDPLAPVGVTPGKNIAAGTTNAASSTDSKSNDPLTQIMDLLTKGKGKDGSKTSGSNSDHPTGGDDLAGLLSGKMKFEDTKIGKAAGVAEGIGKLLKIFAL